MTKLASAGDDVKLWNSNDLSLVKEFVPHDDNICGLSWSIDGTRLASVATNSDKIVIHSVADTVVPLADLQCGPGQLCVSYCNASSRYLLCGGNDQTMTVWDLKSKQIKKTYKNHKGPVTCARFNKDDTHIASGSQSGEIIVYNVITGQGCKPMVAPKVHAIQQIQYSKYKKSLLGTASDDGSINLWDANTRQLIHGFTNTHRAPATDLNFSPINDLLLMSVGLDKRIIYYDLKSKKPVNTMVSERPLTSLDVRNDGVTVATGSIHGKIYVYDLRKGNVPIKILSAHRSSVQALIFQNSRQGSDNYIEDMTERQTFRPQNEQNADMITSNDTQPFNANSHLSSSHDNYESFTGSREMMKPNMSDDVFSPVHNASGDRLSSHSYERLVHNRSASHTGIVSRQDLSGSGVLSPLADPGSSSQRYRGNYGEFSPLGSQPLTGVLQSPDLGTTQPLVTQRELSPRTDPLSGQYRSPDPTAGPSEYVANDGSPHLATASSYRSTDPARSANSVSQNHVSVTSPRNSSQRRSPSVKFSPDSLPVSELQRVNIAGDLVNGADTCSTNSDRFSPYAAGRKLDDSPSATASVDHSQHILSSPEGAQTVGSIVNGGQERPSSNDLPEGATAAFSGTNFQAEFLRNFIRDEMEELRVKIHEENWQLFLDMLRLKTQLKNEIQEMLQYYSVNPALLAEIERLKEENSRLKKLF